MKHSQALFELAKDLGGKMTEGLGLGGLEAFKDWPCQFQMNKYNYNPESVGSTGAVMHSDAGFITILQDDELVNGLEVVNKFTGDLVSVDPIPGTLVINIGDVGMVIISLTNFFSLNIISISTKNASNFCSLESIFRQQYFVTSVYIIIQ